MSGSWCRTATLLLMVVGISACDGDRSPSAIEPPDESGLVAATRMDGAQQLPDLTAGSQVQSSGLTIASAPGAIRFGVWFPYVSHGGIPPVADLAAAGISTTFLSGSLTAAVLANYDVVFIGRAGMIGNFPAGAGTLDLPGLKAWIAAGGTLIGESNALLWDSDVWRGVNWSSQLSIVAGISAPQRGSDFGVGALPVVLNGGHPIAQGVTPSFTLHGSFAHMDGTVLDVAKNPTATSVGTVQGDAIVQAFHGEGCTVNFPTALGFNSTNFPNNPEYQKLFINAIVYCAGSRAIEVSVDIKPGSSDNPINLRGISQGRGRGESVPVAILTTADFDAADIDLSTLTLGNGDAPDTGVSVKNNGSPHAALEDIDGDGDLDLVAHFPLAALVSNGDLSSTTAELCVGGNVNGGTAVHGCDSVRVTN